MALATRQIAPDKVDGNDGVFAISARCRYRAADSVGGGLNHVLWSRACAYSCNDLRSPSPPTPPRSASPPGRVCHSFPSRCGRAAPPLPRATWDSLLVSTLPSLQAFSRRGLPSPSSLFSRPACRAALTHAETLSSFRSLTPAARFYPLRGKSLLRLCVLQCEATDPGRLFCFAFLYTLSCSRFSTVLRVALFRAHSR